jgi:hypothetical protein
MNATDLRRLPVALTIAVAAGCGTVSDGQPVPDSRADRGDPDAGSEVLADATPPDSPDAGVEPAVNCSHNAPFISTAMVGGVNTADAEHNAWLSADERIMVFSRIAAGGGGANLYLATRDSAGVAFETVQEIDELNSAEREVRAALSEDLRTIYFDRAVSASNYDIMIATRGSPEAEFGGGEPVAAVNGDGNSDYHPFLSDAGLYFVSSRGGAVELFFAARAGAGFEDPVPLDMVSSAVSESLPVASADGTALYFAADGRAPDGVGWDVWAASRDSPADDFGEPVLVGGMVNGDAGEAPTWLSPDNCRLYFKSDADGDFDLWVATREP